MKYCRFVPLDAAVQSRAPLYGLLEEKEIHEISGAPWGPGSRASRTWRVADVRLLAPVERGHEVPKEPLIFLKPSSSIVGPGESIVLTRYSQHVEHEGELALVMGRRCAHLQDTDDALSHVFGYTCLNDVSARDIQKSDGQFARAKGFDTFCPIGPHIETAIHPADVLVETHVNGARRQSGSTALMVYSCAFLVRWISRMMTLYPGDVIATGTPAGVGPLVAGDVVEVSVAGIGVLRNPVHRSEE